MTKRAWLVASEATRNADVLVLEALQHALKIIEVLGEVLLLLHLLPGLHGATARWKQKRAECLAQYSLENA